MVQGVRSQLPISQGSFSKQKDPFVFPREKNLITQAEPTLLAEISQGDQSAPSLEEHTEELQTSSFEDVASRVGETALEALPPLFEEVVEERSLSILPDLVLASQEADSKGPKLNYPRRNKLGHFMSNKSEEEQAQFATDIKELAKSSKYWRADGKLWYAQVARALGENERIVRGFVLSKMKGELEPPCDLTLKSQSIEEKKQDILPLINSPDFRDQEGMILICRIAQYLQIRRATVEKFIIKQAGLGKVQDVKGAAAPEVSKTERLKNDQGLLQLINNPDFRFTDGDIYYQKLAKHLKISVDKIKLKVIFEIKEEVLHVTGKCKKRPSVVFIEEKAKQNKKIVQLANNPDYRFQDGGVYYEKIARELELDVRKTRESVNYQKSKIQKMTGNLQRTVKEKVYSTWSKV